MNIVNKLAYTFADAIADHTTEDELRDIIRVNRANRELKPDLCHTGDIIDSNMCMLAAFDDNLGEADLTCDIENALRNRAWQIAKENDFFRGHLVNKTETMLMIRHLSKDDAKTIIDWIGSMQELNTMQHACIKSEHRIIRVNDNSEVTMTW